MNKLTTEEIRDVMTNAEITGQDVAKAVHDAIASELHQEQSATQSEKLYALTEEQRCRMKEFLTYLGDDSGEAPDTLETTRSLLEILATLTPAQAPVVPPGPWVNCPLNNPTQAQMEFWNNCDEEERQLIIDMMDMGEKLKLTPAPQEQKPVVPSAETTATEVLTIILAELGWGRVTAQSEAPRLYEKLLTHGWREGTDKLSSLKELLKVQGNDGNWNYDSYMLGMYNGMELSVAILE
jgi:hypothetical protein